MAEHLALRSRNGRPDFAAARDAVERALPATSDKLKSESWAFIEGITDSHEGRHVMITALDVLYEDVDALEVAVNTPPSGFEAEEDESSATVWHFPANDAGRKLAEVAERLDDFDLLSAAGLELT